MQCSSALVPKSPWSTPKTRSPTASSVTWAPTCSTTPANSLPRMRWRGRRRPAKNLERSRGHRTEPAIRPVHRRRVDAYPDLVGGGLGPRAPPPSQDLRAAVAIVDSCRMLELLCGRGSRWMGPPCCHASPARYSSAGLPPAGPAGAAARSGSAQPSSAAMRRRKLAGSMRMSQTAS